ncbi:hypothetical protein C5167_025482 [Papaver somniferum]|uniref:Tudor domain-containing protein n=1 Tax=Papaver somniferum TaxID=3469 RepID=A0A4Y7JRM0_PAPSO|nr:uncharacterized protein LOC113284227 [Papaver somniferum]RZC63734.1 hypothetical protein C5167_025482 [Papaver somniferum]
MVMDTKISDGGSRSRKRKAGDDRDMVKANMSLPRRRKEVPCFRKVDLSESDFQRIVGKRIKVYWDGSRRWFTGCVESFDSKKKLHRILYNDGDVDGLYLPDERFELEVVTSEGFTLCSSLTTNSVNRELGSVGKKTSVGDSLAERVNKPVEKKGTEEVPCFRKVDLSEADFKRIVGKRIKVYWDGSRRWFTGHIESFDSKKKLHRISYYDGDMEELYLPDERFELEVVTSEGFTLCSSLTTDSINRELGSVGKKTKVGDSLADSVNNKSVEKKLTKELACFRKVDLSESDFKRIIGKRIKVYWDGSRKWFTGHIESFDSKKKLHRILYNDGDVEKLNLLDELFELEVVTSEGFTLCSSLTTNSINGELGSVSKKTNVGDSLADSVNKHVEKKVTKEVACFRKVDLSESDFKRIIGKRIKVYWDGLRKWFTGRIESFDNKKKLHRILYSDGDVEELYLPDERFELDVLTSEGFTLCSRLRTNSVNKQLGSAGKKTKVGNSLADSVNRPVEKKVMKVSEKPYMALPEITRRRKEVPSFRKVELDESDSDRIVGKRIKVYWGGSRRWFTGRIDSFDNEKKLHMIRYDDGDVDELNLLIERMELEVVTSEGFTLCSSLSKNSTNKEPGLVGKKTNVGDSLADSVNKPVEKKVTKVSEKPYMTLPEITRRRKEVPSFRKVELDESDFDRIVGKRIKVYWGGSRRWFTGRIDSFDNEKKLHWIFYDDGDVDELNLLIERIELEVVTSEGFTPCSSLKKKSMKRS